jgi:hypothetical protein
MSRVQKQLLASSCLRVFVIFVIFVTFVFRTIRVFPNFVGFVRVHLENCLCSNAGTAL